LEGHHHGSGSDLLLLEETLTLGMDLPSLHAMLLPKLPVCGLTECLIHHYGIPYSLASDQETYFRAKELQLVEFIGLMFPTILKQLA